MKHLQKFPMINESRSQELNEEKFKELLKTKCKNWKTTNKQILRGTKDIAPFKYINPKLNARDIISIGNEDINFYAIIMENGKNWKNFPRRSNSLIASDDINIINDYAQYDDTNDNILYYVVIPFDDTLWGVTPRNDLWFSYTEEELGARQLSEFNSSLYHTIGSLIGNPNIRINNLEDLIYYLNKIDWLNKELITSKIDKLNKSFEKESEYSDDYSKPPTYKNSILHNLLQSFKNTNNAEKALDLILNSLPTDEFKLLKYNKNGFKLNTNSHEFWSEGESLMIRIDFFEKMFGK